MNILVIDDQKTVVDTICSEMKWENIEIDRAFPAYSAREAQKIILEEKIDIMLSDIEMPDMDGLELYSWVKEQGWDIDCIFLTAHADFSYAKEAIHLGSVEYILQPAKLSDIENVINRVIKERNSRLFLKDLEKLQNFLREKEDVILDRTFEQLLHNGMENGEEKIRQICHKEYRNEFFFLLGIQITRWKKSEWDNALVRMALLNVISELFEQIVCEILIGGVSNTDYVVLIHGDKKQLTENVIEDKIEQLHAFVQMKMDFAIAIYIGGYVKNGMHIALQNLIALQKDNVSLQEKIFDEAKRELLEKKEIETLHQERWNELLEDGSGEVIYQDVASFFKNYREQLYLEIMKSIHLAYSKALFEVINKKQLSVSSFFKETYTYDNFMNCYETCEKMLEGMRYSLNMLQIESKEVKEERISRAKKYISENISKNISRAEVAACVYFNEEYFSRWFSKNTGASFKDYVMKEKLTYAKKMLENTNFSIAIIASKIGCDNFSYFSKMFKKNEGITPQEYRNLHQK